MLERFRLRPSVIFLIFAGILAAAFGALGTCSWTRYTCIECRATRHKTKLLGISFQRISANEYSQSVTARDPGHRHVWGWCGSVEGFNGWGCGTRHPIWGLPVDVHARYARLVPPEQLKSDLEIIDSADREAAIQKVDDILTFVFRSDIRAPQN